MATMLKSWFVALTAGAVKPRTLIWKGRRRKAPDTPPVDVKSEMAKATRGGRNGETSTPEAGKCIGTSSPHHTGLMTDSRPVGLFDSGVGGLTVLDAVARRLPAEDLLYLGDTARLPYGTKSPETIRRYARRAVEFLLERGIKALVV